jgi:hypothetical protein
MSAALPQGTEYPVAVASGANIYVLGGWTGSTRLNTILRYQPSSDTLATMSATLPTGRYGVSATSAGTDIYIFGGFDGSFKDDIMRYSTTTNVLTVLGAKLPTPRAYSGAAWDGTNAYIIGGQGSAGSLSQIVRFTPSTGAVTVMGASLPTARHWVNAIWDGTNALIFGGEQNNGTYTGQILKFNGASITVMSTSLPTPRVGISSVWTGTQALVFGGGSGGPRYADVVRYVPAPVAPTGLVTEPGTVPGTVSLAWTPPASNSWGPTISYLVYRGTTSGGESFLTGTNAATYVDSLPVETSQIPFGRYYYVVRAFNVAGVSQASNEASCSVIGSLEGPLGAC